MTPLSLEYCRRSVNTSVFTINRSWKAQLRLATCWWKPKPTRNRGPQLPR